MRLELQKKLHHNRIGFVLTNLSDYVSTILVLSIGLPDGNPMVNITYSSLGSAGYLILKIISVTFVIGVLHLLAQRAFHKARFLYTSFNVVLLSCSYANIFLVYSGGV